MAGGGQGLKAKGASVKTAKVASTKRSGGKELRAAPRGGADLSAQRRLSLVTALLAVSLLLGIGWFGTFIGVAFPSPDRPGALSGQVTDNQSVIEGALVRMVEPASNITVGTDAGGNFTLQGVRNGRVVFTISKANYTNLTLILYLPPAEASGAPPAFRSQFQMVRGAGDETVDLTGGHDAFVRLCFAVLLIGNVLAAVGTVASLTRRRYRMVVLGGVGAFMAIGFYVGALLGIVAALLVRGARSEFQDQRGLIAPEDMPRLVSKDEDEDDTDGDDEDEDEDEAEDDEQESEDKATRKDEDATDTDAKEEPEK